MEAVAVKDKDHQGVDDGDDRHSSRTWDGVVAVVTP